VNTKIIPGLWLVSRAFTCVTTNQVKQKLKCNFDTDHDLKAISSVKIVAEVAADDKPHVSD